MKRRRNLFEKLNKKEDFKQVYNHGKTVLSGDGKLKANILLINDDARGIKVAVIVSPKSGNAVWRNRVKRILRELIRHEINNLLEIADSKECGLLIVLSPHKTNQSRDNKISLEDIKPAVLDIFIKIKKLTLGL